MFIERILDLFAIVVLGLAPASSFRGRLPDRGPDRVRDRRRGRRDARRWPAHDAQLRPTADRARCRSRTASSSSTTGSRRACSPRSGCAQLPQLVVITALIWATEGDAPVPRRQALGFGDVASRHQRRVLRGADRLAADGRAPHARGDRLRRGRRRRRPDARRTGSARRRRSRSRSSTARSASSRSSSSGRSRTGSRRNGEGRASTRHLDRARPAVRPEATRRCASVRVRRSKATTTQDLVAGRTVGGARVAGMVGRWRPGTRVSFAFATLNRGVRRFPVR